MYLFGEKILRNKQIKITITKLFGIGPKKAASICNSIGIGKMSRVFNMRENKLITLQEKIRNNYIIESQLKKITILNITKQIQMRSYKGIRHKQNYPVRGQRTHSNAMTQKRLDRARYLS